jgi:hypothetical protein
MTQLPVRRLRGCRPLLLLVLAVEEEDGTCGCEEK